MYIDDRNVTTYFYKFFTIHIEQRRLYLHEIVESENVTSHSNKITINWLNNSFPLFKTIGSGILSIF